MLEALMAEHDGMKLTEFLPTPDEGQVWAWLRSLEERTLSGALHTLYQFEEQEEHRNIFFRVPATDLRGNFRHNHMLVVETQEEFYDENYFKTTLIYLTYHVRCVFTGQSTRRFVHAFTLCAPVMELWVFDRCIARGRSVFTINRTFSRARSR
ncbi:hypothetical protein GGR51DRAFT_25474 [Nemania sp. FL0031]|nr:hypothetical protein GGR51DRAFT_25474 [Nemania sp. FL0031]